MLRDSNDDNFHPIDLGHSFVTENLQAEDITTANLDAIIATLPHTKEDWKKSIISTLKQGDLLAIVSILNQYEKKFSMDPARYRFSDTSGDGDTLPMLVLRLPDPSLPILELLLNSDPEMLDHKNRSEQTLLHVFADNTKMSLEKEAAIFQFLSVRIRTRNSFDPNHQDAKRYTALHLTAYHRRGKLFSLMCTLPGIQTNLKTTIGGMHTRAFGWPTEFSPMDTAFLGHTYDAHSQKAQNAAWQMMTTVAYATMGGLSNLLPNASGTQLPNELDSNQRLLVDFLHETTDCHNSITQSLEDYYAAYLRRATQLNSHYPSQ